MKRQVTETLRSQFRPEFLNRIDEVIVFHALTSSRPGARSSDLLIEELGRRLATQDFTLDPHAGGAGAHRSARGRIRRTGRGRSSGRSSASSRIRSRGRSWRATSGRGAHVVGDADPVGGTLVFTTDGATVVSEASERRDARGEGDRDQERVGVGAGAGGSARRKSAFDLPDTELPKRDPEDLVN